MTCMGLRFHKPNNRRVGKNLWLDADKPQSFRCDLVFRHMKWALQITISSRNLPVSDSVWFVVQAQSGLCVVKPQFCVSRPQFHYKGGVDSVSSEDSNEDTMILLHSLILCPFYLNLRLSLALKPV